MQLVTVTFFTVISATSVAVKHMQLTFSKLSVPYAFTMSSYLNTAVVLSNSAADTFAHTEPSGCAIDVSGDSQLWNTSSIGALESLFASVSIENSTFISESFVMRVVSKVSYWYFALVPQLPTEIASEVSSSTSGVSAA